MKGLYANIHAKRERIAAGSKEKMRKPGAKGAPSAADFKAAAKTAKPVKKKSGFPNRSVSRKGKDVSLASIRQALSYFIFMHFPLRIKEVASMVRAYTAPPYSPFSFFLPSTTLTSHELNHTRRVDLIYYLRT